MAERRRVMWTMLLGGIAIIGAAFLLLRQVAQYAVNHTPTAATAPVPSVKITGPANPATLHYAKPAASFSEIEAMDRFYQTAAAKWLGFRFRGVTTAGTNAGLISRVGIRLASGIVPLPATLATAHVTLPAGTPSDQAITGTAGALSDALAASAQAQHIHLSHAEAQSLVAAAARAALAVDSNNPLSLLKFLDGAAPLGSSSLARCAVNPKNSLMQHIGGTSQGDLPNARYFYQAWAVVPSRIGMSWRLAVRVPGQSIGPVAMLKNPVEIEAVASAARGSDIARVAMVPFKSLTMALVGAPRQAHWMVLDYQLNLAPPYIIQVYRSNLDAAGY